MEELWSGDEVKKVLARGGGGREVRGQRKVNSGEDPCSLRLELDSLDQSPTDDQGSGGFGFQAPPGPSPGGVEKLFGSNLFDLHQRLQEKS